MTPDEARQIRIASLKKRGDENPFAHPDVYAEALSILTLHGEVFPIPPLYPDGAVSVIPTFGDGGATVVNVQTDPVLVDAELVALAEKLQDLAPVSDVEACETCGQVTASELEVDPEQHVEFLGAMFSYARLALRRLYDLTDKQIADLLAFTSRDLPPWTTDALAHSLGRPVKG